MDEQLGTGEASGWWEAADRYTCDVILYIYIYIYIYI